jgi:hypothetical protein
MFKLVVLSCIVSVAFAGHLYAPASYAQVKTVVEPHSTIVETPTINHVGTAYKSVPSGVSHHSSSVVHSAANIVEPIYAHGVQKSVVSTPIVKKVVEHVPVVAKYQPAYIQAAPVAYAAHAAPVAAYSAPLSYAAHAAPVAAYSALLSYAAHAAPVAAYSSVYAPKAYGYSAYSAPLTYAAYAPSAYANHW